jgi:hypothetical protein
VSNGLNGFSYETKSIMKIKEIYKYQMVLLLIMLVHLVNAQIVFQNDTVFFGPGLLYTRDKGKLPSIWKSKDLLNMQSGEDGINFYIEYIAFFDERKLFSMKHDFGRGYAQDELDTTVIRKQKSIQFNELTYLVKENTAYNFSNGNEKKIVKQVEYYSISIDTVLFECIRVVMDYHTRKKRKICHVMKTLRHIHVVIPENYPPNQFCLANDSICDGEIRNHFERDDLLALLPCMSPEIIREDYEEDYTTEMDAMFDDFAYVQIADTLESRFVRRKAEKWECQKAALKYFYEGKDASVQKEIMMQQRLFNLQVGLNEFMNYKKERSGTTFFDSLHVIHFRHKILAPLIMPFNSLYSLKEVCNHTPPYALLDISGDSKNLMMDYLLQDFLIRNYFGKNSQQMEVVPLLNDKNQEVYGIRPKSMESEPRFLARIYQETMGEWKVKIDTLKYWNSNYKVDSLFYFNGAISFATGNDFLIMDASKGGHTEFIKSFPDSLPGFNYIAHVQSANELFNDHLEKEFFLNFPENDYRRKSKLGYSIISKEFQFKSIKKGDYAKKESIFIHKGKGDLDMDGIEEIYAYGISDGKVIFANGYTTTNEKLVGLKGDELLKKLKFSVLFNNILLYSQIDNGNE